MQRFLKFRWLSAVLILLAICCLIRTLTDELTCNAHLLFPNGFVALLLSFRLHKVYEKEI